MIKGKKLIVAKFLNILCLLNLIRQFKVDRGLLVVNYHRIRSDNPSDTLNCFDDEVFGPTVSEFNSQIQILKKNTRVLSETELINIIKTENYPREVCSLITFDDGYRDNFTLAYPILKEMKVPAIFFIPTDSISRQKVGWWDIISYLVKNCQKKKITFEGKELLLGEEQQELIGFFQNKMYSEPHSRTKNLLEKLSRACEIPFPSSKIQDEQLMTWDHISELAKNNFSIGSHTHSHRVLTTISTERLMKEVLVSKTIIEEKSGNRVKSIAYPVGGHQHFNDNTKRIIQEYNFKLGFSFYGGYNKWKSIDPYNIKRAHPYGDLVVHKAATILPSLFVRDKR